MPRIPNFFFFSEDEEDEEEEEEQEGEEKEEEGRRVKKEKEKKRGKIAEKRFLEVSYKVGLDSSAEKGRTLTALNDVGKDSSFHLLD